MIRADGPDSYKAGAHSPPATVYGKSGYVTTAAAPGE